MARGKNATYSKEKERGRQYAKRMTQKYANPTFLRLKEKVAEDKDAQASEASLDLVNLYQKRYAVVPKSYTEKKLKDFDLKKS